MMNLKTTAVIVICLGITLLFGVPGFRAYFGITIMLLGLAISIYGDRKTGKS